MSYTASATVTIVAPDGTAVATLPPLTPQGVRMQVEPVENGGSPLAGFPTWEPASPTEGTPTS